MGHQLVVERCALNEARGQAVDADAVALGLHGHCPAKHGNRSHRRANGAFARSRQLSGVLSDTDDRAAALLCHVWQDRMGRVENRGLDSVYRRHQVFGGDFV